MTEVSEDATILLATSWQALSRAKNEGEQGNPNLWRWTPRASVLNVMSAWMTPDGGEWVPDNKKERSKQIHRWGFS